MHFCNLKKISQELFRFESKGSNMGILETPIYLLQGPKEITLLFLSYGENYHGFRAGPDLSVLLYARVLGASPAFLGQRVELNLHLLESLQHFIIPVSIVSHEEDSHKYFLRKAAVSQA
jgi:hypothetical protein